MGRTGGRLVALFLGASARGLQMGRMHCPVGGHDGVAAPDFSPLQC